MKAGQIPDDVKAKIEQNYRNQGSGGGITGLTGSSGTSGGGLFGSGNTGGGGGLFSSSNQNTSVGGLAPPTLQRGIKVIF